MLLTDKLTITSNQRSHFLFLNEFPCPTTIRSWDPSLLSLPLLSLDFQPALVPGLSLRSHSNESKSS